MQFVRFEFHPGDDDASFSFCHASLFRDMYYDWRATTGRRPASKQTIVTGTQLQCCGGELLEVEEPYFDSPNRSVPVTTRPLTARGSVCFPFLLLLLRNI